jgi:hypothetical protein
VVDIQWQPPRLSRLSGPVGQLVRHKRRELVVAAAAHDVRNLRVFGSVARGEDRADSDRARCDPDAAFPQLSRHAIENHRVGEGRRLLGHTHLTSSLASASS